MRANISRENAETLKGVSILCVMCGHFWGQWTRYISPIAGIGVALFLVCSGYGLEKSFQKNGLKYFWKKRFWTVFFPYLTFEIVRFCMGDLSYQTFWEFLEDVTLIKPRYGYGWYLTYILIWYVIFYVSHLIIKNERLRDVVLIAIALLLLIYYVSGDCGLQIEQSFTFVLGVFLAKYDLGKLYKKRIVIGCVAVAAFALAVKQVPCVRNSTSQIMRWMDLITKSFMGFGAAAGVEIFKLQKNIKWVFGKVGMISYELYLIHGVVLGIIRRYINSPVGIFPFLLLSITLAGLYHIILELVRKKVIYKC